MHKCISCGLRDSKTQSRSDFLGIEVSIVLDQAIDKALTEDVYTDEINS